MAASQRESGERSVAQVVAEWRERSARGEPVDTEEMLAEIEQAEQAAVPTDSLRASQFPSVAKDDTEEQAKTPTLSLQPEATAIRGVSPHAAQNAPTLNPSGAFANISSLLRERLGAAASAGGQVSGLEDYDVLREIAKGGMGVVYEARQRSLNRIVALKMIKAGQLANVEDVARFYAEAEAAANLRHPNIVAVYEVGRADIAQHYFTMDYVAGPSLLDVIRKQPLAAREAAAYVVKVARAIQFAHDRNVLHRDLKPSNILLGEDGEPRVTDFGLAKRIDQDARLTVAGAVVGTPAYMPPEQARGDTRHVGRAADIYSLGAVLYECVTGRPPFISSSLTEMLQQVLLDDPVPPSRLLPSLPRDYETICLKCLEKEPERRYTSAGDLADDLERFLRDEPIRARPVSLPERALKFARRKPVWAALWGVSALAIVVLAAVIATYTSSLRDEVTRRTKSEAEEKKQKNLAQANYDSLRTTTYSTVIQKSEDYWTDDPPNLARGEELLETLVPGAGERDLRGFEWYFLKRLCAGPARGQRSFPTLEELVVRDDGSLLLSDAEVSPFVAQHRDGKEVQRWKVDGGSSTERFVFSKSGPWCLALGSTNTIELRRWQNPQEQGPVVVQLTQPGFLAALADDGSRVAYAAPNKAVVVWSVDERKTTHSFGVSVANLREIRFSPDGQWVLECGEYEVRCTELERRIRAHYETKRKARIAGAAFSPDSRRLALTFKDGSVDVYDLSKAAEPNPRPELSINLLKFYIYPSVIAYLPGERVALGSQNSFVVVVDLVRGVPTLYRGHRASVSHLAGSPDGRTLYSGATNGEVLAWDLAIEDQRAEVIRDFGPGESPLTFDCLSYSPDGRWLAAGGRLITDQAPEVYPGRLLLIDPQSRRIVQRIDSPHPVTTCSISPDSQHLVYGDAQAVASSPFYLWDLAAGRPAGEHTFDKSPAQSVCFVRGGKLALGGVDGQMTAVSAGQPGARQAWITQVDTSRESNRRIESLVASADGRLVLTHNCGHLIRLWDAERGEEVLRSGGHSIPAAMGLSADGKLAAWTTPDPRTVQSAQLTGFVPSPEVAPPGRIANHHRAILFDVENRKVQFVVAGHAVRVSALALSADGSRLASGDSTGILKLWDTATASELLSMDAHLHGVKAIAFHPGGRQLASIGGDGVVRIWWTD